MEFFNSFSSHDFKLDSLLDFSPLTKPQKQYLTKVYALLSYAICMSAVGAAFNNFIFSLPILLSSLGALGCIIFGDFSQRSSYSLKPFSRTRYICYSSSFFLMGCSIGNLLYFAAIIDPSIIPTAFFGTLSIFTCFSICAFYIKNRSFYLIGSALSSMFFFLFMTQISNIFLRSLALQNFTLYIGFFMFLGYVIYDTQVILRQFSSGNADYFSHSLMLFSDFFAIFVRLVIILIKNNKKREKKKDQ